MIVVIMNADSYYSVIYVVGGIFDIRYSIHAPDVIPMSIPTVPYFFLFLFLLFILALSLSFFLIDIYRHYHSEDTSFMDYSSIFDLFHSYLP